MRKTSRVAAGLAALGLCAVLLDAPSAQSRTSGCSGSPLRQLGAVTVSGCWQPSGSGWRAPLPVSLNGMTIVGGGTIALDPRAGTLRSSRTAAWRFGRIQFAHTPFAWRRGTPVSFGAVGSVRSLHFAGAATLRFTRAGGGTTTLSTELNLPAIPRGVSGQAVLRASRFHAFDLRRLHVAVGELPLGRLVLSDLDFTYAAGAWSANAAIRLPAFTGSTATLAGHVKLAHGALQDLSVQGSGLSIPLGEGFVLTRAGFGLGLHPLTVQGTGAATYGPPIAGGGPLLVVGKLQYRSVPEQWEATGTVSLPWGIPGVKPTASVGLTIQPGQSMSFTGDLNLTVHGWGLKAHLDGYASGRRFNAEGDSTLKLPLVGLSGTTLVSSRGLAACGRIHLLFLSERVGFGYTWGGSLDLMGSSCDVGRYRAPVRARSLGAAGVDVVTSSPALFAVFAAQGGDFQVTGPTGTFASTPDRDDPTAFATHDASTGVAYLAIPVKDTPATYTVTPLTEGTTLKDVTVADGLTTHAGSGDVSGSVTGSGTNLTLDYGIATDQFAPGETVSFYQGASSSLAGAAPIVENVTTSNTASFTPEPLGPPVRTVFAVVSIDGRPREEFPIATFSVASLAPPSASVFVAPGAGGWTVTLGKPQRVAGWQVLTSANDGRREWQELPGSTASFLVPAGRATQATVVLTPLDQFGRAGPTYTCDSAKPGGCASG